MHFTKQASLTAAAVAAITCPAFGTISVSLDVTTSGPSVANALSITASSSWNGANLFVELTQGFVVNLDPGSGGGDFAPTQAEIEANPALLFDTYVGRVNGMESPTGGAVELGGSDTFSLGPTGISAEWIDDQSSNPQMIGNLVFSDDAQGVWSLGVIESHNAQVKFLGGTLTDGVLLTDFVPGDLNVDNFTGIEDLNLVLGEWNTDGSGDPRSDPTGDGFVGIEDLNEVLGDWNAGTAQGPWSYVPVGQSGDLDGDGFVGITDLNILLGAWHQAVTPGSMSDPSGDGFVGLDDMNIVLTFMGGGTIPGGGVFIWGVIPEPSGLALMSLGTLAALRRRHA